MAKYYYNFNEERGEYRGYVEDSYGKQVWSVTYPDFYEDEESGELIETSTIFEHGYMKDTTDIEGLEDYLKKMGILKSGDELEFVDDDEENYADGGEIKWQDVNRGDSARVKSENKMGLIVHTYGRKFHLKFPNGKEKTYDASELEFFKDEEFAKGGVITKKERDNVISKLIKDRENELSVFSLPVNIVKNSLGNPNIYVGVIPYYSWYTKKELTFVISYGRYLSVEMLVYGSYKKDDSFIEVKGKENAIKVLNKILDNIEKSFSGNKMAEGGTLNTRVINKIKAQKPFELPLELSVYVPSTKDASQIISKREYNQRIEEVQRFLADLFGGFSSVSVEGGYVSDEKGLINEDVTRVVAFASKEGFEKKLDTLLKKIVDWCGYWSQESIGFEYEGDLFYIDAKSKFEYGGQVI